MEYGEVVAVVPGEPGPDIVLTIPEGGGWLTEGKAKPTRTKQEIYKAAAQKILEKSKKRKEIALKLSKAKKS